MNDPKAEAQRISVTTIGNARELGGYAAADGRHIKRGRLLRTCHLAGASEDDLRRLADEYRVKLIVDFRSDAEVARLPDPEVEGARYVHIPVIDERLFGSGGADAVAHNDDPRDQIGGMLRIAETQNLSGLYSMIVQSEYGQRGFERFFREVLDTPDGAVLWHCTTGKDRTGLAAAFLLSALDVDWDTILFDFELTNVFTADKLDAMRRELERRGCAEELVETVVTTFVGVNGKYLKNAWTSMKASDGSIMGYLQNKLHLSDGDIATLRDRYLE